MRGVCKDECANGWRTQGGGGVAEALHLTYRRIAVGKRVAPIGARCLKEELCRRVPARAPLGCAPAEDVHFGARTDPREERPDDHVFRSRLAEGLFTKFNLTRPRENGRTSAPMCLSNYHSLYAPLLIFCPCMSQGTLSFAPKAVIIAFHRLLYLFGLSCAHPCGRSPHRDIGLDGEKRWGCADRLRL